MNGFYLAIRVLQRHGLYPSSRLGSGGCEAHPAIGKAMKDWINPTLTFRAGHLIITDHELAGMRIVRVRAQRCPATRRADSRVVCGLVLGHDAEHWECDVELAGTEGPFAVINDDITARDWDQVRA